jgi:hydroxyethylthiazole kinase-like uncharacterized protein yjeF
MSIYYLPNAEEMRSFDQHTISNGTSGLQLMERAGAACVKYLIKEKIITKPSRIVICCGSGNNGGDGLVIARELHNKGFRVSVLLVLSKRYSFENSKNCKKFLDIKGKLFCLKGKSSNDIPSINREKASHLIKQSDVIIDAILGNGQTKAANGEIKKFVSLINESKLNVKKKVIAIDIPTGVNSSTGEIYNSYLEASLSLAIEFRKSGMSQYPGKGICGEQVIIPIGINANKKPQFTSFNPKIDTVIPTRRTYSHKGSYGSVFVIGGSLDMPGAPKLSAFAALRSGAGTVTQTVLNKEEEHDCNAEIMLRHLEHSDGVYQLKNRELLFQSIKNSSAIVLGPGLSTKNPIPQLVKKLIAYLISQNKKFVLDADGLNAIAPIRSKISLKNCVLTPHPGEAARLLSTTTNKIEKDRFTAALALANKTEATVILKGASTIIANKHGGFVHEDSSPYLATAGSGDVLSGIVASLMAQGLSPIEAAKTGVFIHAQSGLRAVKKNKGPIIASDIIAQIPSVIGVHQV